MILRIISCEKRVTGSAMFEFLNFLVRRNKFTGHKYKLVDWFDKNNSSKGVCRISILGTGNYADYPTETIVADEEFLMGFHPMDIFTITNLASYEAMRPKNKLMRIDHIRNYFTILTENNEELSIDILNVEKVMEIINKLSPLDAYRVGRLAGDNDSVI